MKDVTARHVNSSGDPILLVNDTNGVDLKLTDRKCRETNGLTSPLIGRCCWRKLVFLQLTNKDKWPPLLFVYHPPSCLHLCATRALSNKDQLALPVVDSISFLLLVFHLDISGDSLWMMILNPPSPRSSTFFISLEERSRQRSKFVSGIGLPIFPLPVINSHFISNAGRLQQTN